MARRAAASASCLALAAALTVPTAAAEGPRPDELKALQQRIDQAESARQEAATEAGAAVAELRRHELAIGTTATRLREIEQGIAGRTATLKDLAARRDGHARRLEELRAGLARQIRAAYLDGSRQDTIKLLLSQDDPRRLSRMMTYHGHVARARAGQIDAVRAELKAIEDLTLAVKLENDRLRQLQAEQARGMADLASLRRVRSEAVDRLQAQMQRREAELETLKADARQLESLIETLARKPAAAPADESPFGKLKGKLAWPVAGSIARKFGQATNRAADGGELTARGVFLTAAAGTPVRAVATGRVVFADWFQSLGMLLIVDHGDGYMSLYGHNQSLTRAVGETVAAADTIAMSGDSGGIAEPGLHFEIRRNGTPLNPAHWCR
jgi:septal ring factor EnvC (AmiA/AmiB activator)